MNPFRKAYKQASIFITAGYPELDSLPDQIAFLEASGVDFIEIGIPFSDPMADGPVIQASSAKAIDNGMTIAQMFHQLEGVTAKIPLVIMSYLNPIMHYGEEHFIDHCLAVGIRHLIVPDISLEIYEKAYRQLFESRGMTLCFLVTPETEQSRVERMAEHSKNGFIYLVSTTMTTGNIVLSDQGLSYERIRKSCGNTPMMIGFGIRSAKDLERVQNASDGGIIGSAYLEALKSGRHGDFIASLTLSSLPRNL